MLTSAPGSSENRLDKEQSTSKHVEQQQPKRISESFLKLLWELVEFMVATFWEVGLQNFSEQISF